MEYRPINVRVDSFFGAFVITVGTNVFPRMFSTMKEAQAVAAKIRDTHNQQTL